MVLGTAVVEIAVSADRVREAACRGIEPHGAGIASRPPAPNAGQLARLASRLTKNIAGPVCSTIVTAAASAANAAYNLVYLAMPNRPAATSRKASHFRHRSLRFEQCEERRVLSASLAATPNPAVYGQPVTAIASLPSGTTGSVSLKDGTTVIGTATVQPASRPALQFDGTSGYVDLGSSNAFNFQANQAFSVSFWINSTDTNEPMIVGKGEGFLGHNATGWSIFTYSGYLYFQLNAGVKSASDELQAWDLSTPICNGLWHHVTVTYDGSKTASGTRFYIDGVAQTLGTDSNDLWANAIHSNVDATIGAAPAGSSYFSGELQQVLLFNTQISEAEDTGDLQQRHGRLRRGGLDRRAGGRLRRRYRGRRGGRFFRKRQRRHAHRPRDGRHGTGGRLFGRRGNVHRVHSLRGHDAAFAHRRLQRRRQRLQYRERDRGPGSTGHCLDVLGRRIRGRAIGDFRGCLAQQSRRHLTDLQRGGTEEVGKTLEPFALGSALQGYLFFGGQANVDLLGRVPCRTGPAASGLAPTSRPPRRRALLRIRDATIRRLAVAENVRKLQSAAVPMPVFAVKNDLVFGRGLSRSFITAAGKGRSIASQIFLTWRT